MALPTYYSAGTVTLAAGGTAVTGVGTAWTSVLQPGDLFTNASGLMVRIASIQSDTALTLARAWPGAAIAGGAYEIQLTPRSVGVQEATRQLLLMLSDGNLSSIAALNSAADKMPYYTGSGTAALATLSAFARTLLDDTNATTALATLGAVQQGGLPGLPDHRIRIGWDNNLRSYVDDVDIGKVWSDYGTALSLAVTGYAKLPSGLIVQWGSISLGASETTVTFPIAFSAAVYCVCVSPHGGAAADVSVQQWVNSRGSTSFIVSTRRAANGGLVDSIAFPTGWIAIGA